MNKFTESRLTVSISRYFACVITFSTALLHTMTSFADVERLSEHQQCSYPASAVVKLELEGVNGNGTAFFIGSNRLLTNAHLARHTHKITLNSPCLSPIGAFEARIINTWFDRNAIERDVEEQIYTLDGALIPTSEDWAILEIDAPFGDQLGYFQVIGSNSYQSVDTGNREPLPNPFLCETHLNSLKSGLIACTIGYPRLYRPSMTHSIASIRQVKSGLARDSSGYIGNFGVLGGSSGSPVYYFDTNTNTAVAIGIIQGGSQDVETHRLLYNYITEINNLIIN